MTPADRQGRSCWYESDENGAHMVLLRGFDELSDLSIADGNTTVRQSFHITLISDVAEGILVQSHNLINSRYDGAVNLEVKGDCHKLNKEMNTTEKSPR